MNNKEFEQMVKDASPQDLSDDDLNCSIEFYRYQNRMAVGEQVQKVPDRSYEEFRASDGC